ncbi:MAG TPA: DEAD/DEAH box helicase [Pseudomonadales bacterium]|nr:DEAD/DEAH box helicase [Pseudomonadales bacterium]
MNPETATPVAFSDLGLPEAMLNVLSDIGYETPSAIQAQTIPLLLEGRDLLGQAQTGTGKTAAFALPILARLDMTSAKTQVLVLAPTRELAIQVAEAFQTYAAFIKNFHVLPIYGGADYRGQLKQLKQGAQVVVGTPGRVMDHMRRGTLDLSNLQCLVLDEADEMLRMGFIDDVEWILEQTPDERQIALFSATMPREVRRIAQQHLNNPAEITITLKTTTASTIRQRYWAVSGMHKLDALTRMLEAETFDGIIIFVRTKTATVELADKLRARGYNTAALNGDIAQSQREHTVAQIKSGAIDILVATDVAARGLDVDRISHVINYDIPTDTEAYVHRIGRTGRAGRTGDAILFVAPREKRLLFAIEKATRQPIELMELPSVKLINDIRIEKFKQRITETLEKGGLDLYRDLIAQYQHETGTELEQIAGALAAMAQGTGELLLNEKDAPRAVALSDDRPPRRERSDRDGERSQRGARTRTDKPVRELEEGMQRYRIDVGYAHSVKPGNIVGAIANEADIDSKHIGHIAIHDDYSTVDLPVGLSDDVLQVLKKVRVAGRPMNLARLGEGKTDAEGQKAFPAREKSFADKKSFPDKKPFAEKKTFSDKKPFSDKKSFADKSVQRPVANKDFFARPERSAPPRDATAPGGKREVNGNSIDYVPPKAAKPKSTFRPRVNTGAPGVRFPSDSNRPAAERPSGSRPIIRTTGKPPSKPFKK